MISLTTSSGSFGPFKIIDTLSDRYKCDDCELPFSVVGVGSIGPYVAPPIDPVILVKSKNTFVTRIDSDVDAIYQAVVGNRSDEYTQAYNDASAYKAAGYTGIAGTSITSWATAKSWTNTQAADDILLAAARLAGLRDIIRAQRLSKKELAKAAVDQAALDGVIAQWNAALAAIKASAGL